MTYIALLALLAATACLGTSQTSPSQPDRKSIQPVHILLRGLDASQRKILTDRLAKMTQAERDVLIERCALCESDPHKGGPNTKPYATGPNSDSHDLSGLTKSEKATWRKLWPKIKGKDRELFNLALENACNRGIFGK